MVDAKITAETLLSRPVRGHKSGCQCPICHIGRVAAIELTIANAREEQQAEIDRLQAIVDKLPKTADGVPITPNMQLYYLCDDWGGKGTTRVATKYRDAGRTCPETMDCYSTPEAAEQAKENPNDHSENFENFDDSQHGPSGGYEGPDMVTEGDK